MKRLILIAAMLLTGALGAFAQEEPSSLEGAWCLCSIESYDGDALTGAMTVQKDYIEFMADGVCVMLISKQEKEFSYEPETGTLTIGVRRVKVLRLTEDELLWEEVSGGTTLRYCLRKKE